MRISQNLTGVSRWNLRHIFFFFFFFFLKTKVLVDFQTHVSVPLSFSKCKLRKISPYNFLLFFVWIFKVLTFLLCTLKNSNIFLKHWKYQMLAFWIYYMYPTVMKLGRVRPRLKIWKLSKSCDSPVARLNSFEIKIFSPDISNFCCISKYRNKLHFDTFFRIFSTFVKSL